MAKSKKYWRNKADKEWSKVIRQVGRCERCNEKGQLHPHHIIGRANYAYRHDLSNGVCLCANCHTLAPYSAHKDRTSFLNWLKKCRPGQWQWLEEHTVCSEQLVGGKMEKKYRAIKGDAPDDEQEYQVLKQMKVGEK